MTIPLIVALEGCKVPFVSLYGFSHILEMENGDYLLFMKVGKPIRVSAQQAQPLLKALGKCAANTQLLIEQNPDDV